jgi:hypothetical protein
MIIDVVKAVVKGEELLQVVAEIEVITEGGVGVIRRNSILIVYVERAVIGNTNSPDFYKIAPFNNPVVNAFGQNSPFSIFNNNGTCNDIGVAE